MPDIWTDVKYDNALYSHEPFIPCSSRWPMVLPMDERRALYYLSTTLFGRSTYDVGAVANSQRPGKGKYKADELACSLFKIAKMGIAPSRPSNTVATGSVERKRNI